MATSGWFGRWRAIRASWRLALIGLVSFAVTGVLESSLLSPVVTSLISLAHTIMVSVMSFFWCGLHAREYAIRVHWGYKLGSALLPVLGIPVYLYRHFGLRAGAWKLVKGLLMMVLAVVLYLLPFAATYVAMEYGWTY